MGSTDSRVIRFLEGLKGKKVTFCGIGRSNAPSAELFASYGAQITVCDRRTREEMGEMADRMEKIGAKLCLGEDYLSSLDADMIFRTPGMQYYVPEFIEARRKGIAVTSEMEIFFELCPCPIIAITGSNGKTTTSSIVYRMLEAQGKNAHLGGNIGIAVLPLIEELCPDDVMVLEISNFQLLSMRQSPDIAVMTNVTPDHLDFHKDMQEYVDAKRNIFLHQNAFGKAVFNEDNEMTSAFAEEARGYAMKFSLDKKVEHGAWLRDDGMIVLSEGDKETEVLDSKKIKLPGRHNIANYMAAICAVWGIVDVENIRKVAEEFSGVEHRAEFVRELNGVKYYNDSIATTPAKAIFGMLSMFDKKIILLAGGYDKLIPFDPLGPAAVKKASKLILFGATADKIEKAVREAEGYSEGNPEIYRVENMEQAIEKAHSLATAGDIVSLSPACASFDQFPSYEVRGREFKKKVMSLK